MGERSGAGGGGGANSLGRGVFNENQDIADVQGIIGGSLIGAVPVENRPMRRHLLGQAQVAGNVVGEVNLGRQNETLNANVTYRTQRRPHAVTPTGARSGPGESYLTTINVGNASLRIVTSQPTGGQPRTVAQVVTGRGRNRRVHRSVNLSERGTSLAADRAGLANTLLSRVRR